VETKKQLFHSILNGSWTGKIPKIVPINPPILDIMKKADIYWPDAHVKADLMSGLSSACHTVLGFNAVNVPFDMAVEAEALGCKTVWKEGRTSIPQIAEFGGEKITIHSGEGILEKGRFPVVLEAVELLTAEYGGTIPVIPFCEGPFTLACLVRGMNDMYRSLIRKPDQAKGILEQVTVVLIRYIDALIQRGADSVIVLDPNVMGLTEKHFNDLVLPWYREITARSSAPLILHICGNVTRILDSIPFSGFAAFSFDYPATSLRTVKERLAGRVGIIGSIPTVTHLLNGSREDVIQVSLEMVSGGVDLLAPSCFTPPLAPLANLRALGEVLDMVSG
jgi:[methyl-Co(III) methanol-specific corrinoid protein]:coenzyme M methyltransferase